MLIKKVCERCHLTKKAIEYYETNGLVQPKILQNGYRDYDEKEIAKLKEISVLRRCGIGISAIKEILASSNKVAALKKYMFIAELRMERLTAIQKCLDGLVQNYDIDREFHYLSEHLEDIYTIKEQLVFAFPGNYGVFLSLHFGRFLNEEIDTEEKRAAYAAIVTYLDRVDLYLTPELSDFLEAVTSHYEKNDIAALQSQVSDSMLKAPSDIEAYLEKNQDEIERYLAYRISEEYKQSPEGQMQQNMLAFQTSSGYQEIFIAGMKILSQSYCEYLQQMGKANQKLIQRFPTAKGLYEP